MLAGEAPVLILRPQKGAMEGGAWRECFAGGVYEFQRQNDGAAPRKLAAERGQAFERNSRQANADHGGRTSRSLPLEKGIKTAPCAPAKRGHTV